MRIWSLHPAYLDTKGLVALWRETLLAKHVLSGLTKGYTNHPQLNRFKASSAPLSRIDQYLQVVYQEATDRGYKFDRSKVNWDVPHGIIEVTNGQVQYEKKHLLNKLEQRDPVKKEVLLKDKTPHIHPLFKMIEGPIESWEIT